MGVVKARRKLGRVVRAVARSLRRCHQLAATPRWRAIVADALTRAVELPPQAFAVAVRSNLFDLLAPGPGREGEALANFAALATFHDAGRRWSRRAYRCAVAVCNAVGGVRQ